MISLLLGWIGFLARVLRTVRWDAIELVTGAVVVLLTVAGLHSFCRWIYAHVQRQRAVESPAPWRLGWTVALVGSAVLLFVSGLAFTGLVQHLRWTQTETEPYYVWRYESDGGGRRHLQLAGQWITNEFNFDYPDEKVSRDAQGRPLHSWQTVALICSWQYNLVDLDFSKPWNDPQHDQYFTKAVVEYTNPAVRTPVNVPAPKYAPSHIAGNIHVMEKGGRMRAVDIPDGLSQTIAAGQIAGGFRPWGEPGNCRDPGLGINAHPQGFGAPVGQGAYMVMLDGSVRFFANGTDPAVLRALATPAGNEPAGAYSEADAEPAVR